MVDIALEACDYKFQIGYVDDVRFTWYTFGGMDSWMGLALAVDDLYVCLVIMV